MRKEKSKRVSERIEDLRAKLKNLEQEEPEEHQRSIVEAGKEAIRSMLSRLGREMRNLE